MALSTVIWIGIDGYVAGSNTLEQIGIAVDVKILGITDYYAWYETVPAGPQRIGMTIHPGDKMYAEVRYFTGQFYLFIRDITTGDYVFTWQTRTNADRSSAEWIVEAPTGLFGIMPLADFGTAIFRNCRAQINDWVGSISFFPHDAITMKTDDGKTIKASPSALFAAGTSFTVTWKHS